jgi:hypothetical protein
MIPLALVATIGLAAPASAFTCAEKVNALEAKLMMGTSVQGGIQTQKQADKIGDAAANLPVTDSGAASGGTQTESVAKNVEAADEKIPNTGSSNLSTDPLSGFRSGDDTGDGNAAVSPDVATVKTNVEQAKLAMNAGDEAKCQTHADAALMEYGVKG